MAMTTKASKFRTPLSSKLGHSDAGAILESWLRDASMQNVMLTAHRIHSKVGATAIEGEPDS